VNRGRLDGETTERVTSQFSEARLRLQVRGAWDLGAEKVCRLMNQAFFKRVLVTEDGVVGWE
jgi:hypothetical protein